MKATNNGEKGMTAENSNSITLKSEKEILETDQVVSFKGRFLDQLTDAVALIEVVEIIIRHHDDVYLRKSGFMGLAMLIEQIKQLLDINANLLPQDSAHTNKLMLKKHDDVDTAR